ncbi:MAG: PqqD family protein [Velocimicrobium sp.]
MKITDGYVLRNIQETYYLLPIGQNIATHKRGIQLNDTGVFLWNAIKQGASKTDLLRLMVKRYDADLDDTLLLQADIESFIQKLTSLSILSDHINKETCTMYFKIGTIFIGYSGPEALIHPSLFTFCCNETLIDQHWIIKTSPSFPLPTGELLIRTNELEVCKNNEYYNITYFDNLQLPNVQISLDGTHAYFYCMSPFHSSLPESLFHSFRLAFLIIAQTKGTFALHSSSILYENKAWLFAGSSGTGKSTHTTMWHNLYQTPVLNGDVNLISIQNGLPIVWGTPWCGTSGIYTKQAYPLGGIILLKKSPKNEIHPLNKSEQQLMVMQRFISPTWTETLFDYNLTFSGDLMHLIPIFRFLCNKEPSAANTIKQYIDETLDY